jgi:hypothetical protein
MLQPSSMLITFWIIVLCMVFGQVVDLVDGLTGCAEVVSGMCLNDWHLSVTTLSVLTEGERTRPNMTLLLR